MIPRDYITAWRSKVPWIPDFQVEQDLVISRALVEIFSHPVLTRSLAFRGGTALNKLFLKPPARYSEDIDLVQTEAGPAGPIMDELRRLLDPWLGNPQRKQSENGVTLTYRFASEGEPAVPLRLKVEINSREHFTVFGMKRIDFEVQSRWSAGVQAGVCKVQTYELDELLGTKLRALFQRRKGRDLFDLAIIPEKANVNSDRVIQAFLQYMEFEGHSVTRQVFEENLAAKMRHPQFSADLTPLLAEGVSWIPTEAYHSVMERFVSRLPE
jgi:predicted nucleotidyltransferase component of viral defense system